MDKVNEAIEVSEQEIPFHLLPHQEQQRIINTNRGFDLDWGLVSVRR